MLISPNFNFLNCYHNGNLKSERFVQEGSKLKNSEKNARGVYVLNIKERKSFGNKKVKICSEFLLLISKF